MSALFNYFSIFDHDDVVGIHDGTQAMRHDDQGFAPEIFIQVFHDHHLVEHIQCGSSFIEEQVFRVFVHSAGNVQTLFLALAQAESFRANFGIVAHWQSFDKALDVGHFYCTKQFFLIDYFVAQGYVARNGVVKNVPFLHDHPTFFPPNAVAEVAHQHIPHPNGAFIGFVKIEEQFEQGCFSTATPAHNRSGFAFWNPQIQPFEYHR